MRQKIAIGCYGVNALVSFALGSLYLLRETYMPYHVDALGLAWYQLDAPLRVLIGALMDVIGAGWIALGLATVVLIWVPMRKGERWSRLLIPALFLVFYVPTLLATLRVLSETAATPPWYGNAMACLSALAGVLADRPWREEPGASDQQP